MMDEVLIEDMKFILNDPESTKEERIDAALILNSLERKKQFGGKKKKRKRTYKPKIYTTKKGRKYIRLRNKKVYLRGENMTDNELIKWILKNLLIKKKRKQRTKQPNARLEGSKSWVTQGSSVIDKQHQIEDIERAKLRLEQQQLKDERKELEQLKKHEKKEVKELKHEEKKAITYDHNDDGGDDDKDEEEIDRKHESKEPRREQLLSAHRRGIEEEQERVKLRLKEADDARSELQNRYIVDMKDAKKREIMLRLSHQIKEKVDERNKRIDNDVAAVMADIIGKVETVARENALSEINIKKKEEKLRTIGKQSEKDREANVKKGAEWLRKNKDPDLFAEIAKSLENRGMKDAKEFYLSKNNFSFTSFARALENLGHSFDPVYGYNYQEETPNLSLKEREITETHPIEGSIKKKAIEYLETKYKTENLVKIAKSSDIDIKGKKTLRGILNTIVDSSKDSKLKTEYENVFNKIRRVVSTREDIHKLSNTDIAVIVQTGFGKKELDGMTDLQIDEIMKKYPEYIGTIARNEIPKLLPYIKKRSRVAWIMNTDPSTKEGEHWVSLLVDARPKGDASVEYYDSYGEDLPKDIQKALKKVVDKMYANTYLKVKVNRIKHQSLNSSNCGPFAIKFIQDRLGRNKTFQQASGYEDAIKSDVGRSEEEIEKFKTMPAFTGRM